MDRLCALLYQVLSFLPWLSLRCVHVVAPVDTRFSKLPGWVVYTNVLASLTLYGLFLASLPRLYGRLPVAASVNLCLVFVTGALFVSIWRPALAAAIGTALVALGAVGDDPVTVALGTANLGTWLLLAWEKQEFHRVWTFKPIRLESINVGSARMLQGNVRILHLFLDTPRRTWRQRSRLAALRQVDRACRWMIRSAKAYHVSLEFEHQIVNGDAVSYSGEIPTAENGYKEMAAFEDFLSAVCSMERVRDDQFNGEESERCLIVHLAEDIGCQAYAVPRHRGQAKGPLSIEYTVVGAWRSASIYAHELLHLFGAYDLQFSSYSDSPSSRQWDQVRRTMLRRSIMFDVNGPLRQFAIDDQTAQCIGWL